MQSKNILVTGTSRGIGAVVALELASRGHRVGCVSRKGVGPEEMEIPTALRDRLVFLKADVLDAASVKRALEEFAVTAGVINGLVNNAGVHLEAPSDRQSLQDFEAVLQTNSTAVFSVCQQAYPLLAAAQGSLIVNMGSFFDKLGVRRNAAYCASKAAVGAITRCLAVEWAKVRIRLVNVAPGYIETDLNREFLSTDKFRAFLASRIPVGGPGSIADVARFIACLFAEDIPFLTGETIYLDGGQGITM